MKEDRAGKSEGGRKGEEEGRGKSEGGGSREE